MSEYYSPPERPGLPRAVAVVMGNHAYPQIRGTVLFMQTYGGVFVRANITGLPQTPTNFFAFHLHEGTCERRESTPPTEEAFPESGGHYNPRGNPHPRHAGDFPPLLATNYGQAQLSFLTDRFSVSEIIGRSVIIHLNPDDFHTQPSGNAGPKIACGLIGPERGPGQY